MASIRHEVPVAVSADVAWRAVREVGQAHTLFAPVLVDGQLEGNLRTVTFSNGLVAHERILDVDDAHRRVGYAVLDVPGVEYHHASMEIVPDGAGRCRFVWITDLWPDGPKAAIQPLVEQGSAALKANLEARR